MYNIIFYKLKNEYLYEINIYNSVNFDNLKFCNIPKFLAVLILINFILL